MTGQGILLAVPAAGMTLANNLMMRAGMARACGLSLQLDAMP